MNNKLQNIGMILIFLTITACSDNAPPPSDPEDFTNSLNQESLSDIENISERLSESLDVVRKDLPIAVDDVTTLEGIDSDELTVIYNYRIKVSGLDPSEKSKFESDIQNVNTRNICNNPKTSKFLEMGVSYNYNYQDLDNISIRGFEVTKDICDNL